MNFNLQKAAFSSGEQDEEDLMIPSAQLMYEYNRQYSIIVKEIQNFLKQCKESVQRFVAYNNFGINFNLQSLLGSLIGVENVFKNKLIEQQQKKTKKDPKSQIKNTYEMRFNKIIKRMGDILKDFLDCQISFKQQYFGVKMIQTSQNYHKDPFMSSRNLLNSYSISSLTHSSKSSIINSIAHTQNQQQQQKRQSQLRRTLKQKLKPTISKLQRECKEEYSTTQNLYRLNQKMDKIIEDIKFVKNREEKMIELFNLNIVKKIHQNYQQNVQIIVDNNDKTKNICLQRKTTKNQQQDDVDEFLDNCRSIRKDSDELINNQWNQKKIFLKKAKILNKNSLS